MRPLPILAGVFLAASAFAQSCPDTPLYKTCDLVLEMSAQEAAAHSNPYLSVRLHAEILTPKHRTMTIPGFWDGGRRFVIRFAPIYEGDWTFRTTSNVASMSGKTGTVKGVASPLPGFLRVQNTFHWSYTGELRPHLWMGDTSYRFAWIDRAVFDQTIEARAKQKFNHIRGLVMSSDERDRPAFRDADNPTVEHFQELDRRILAMNEKGIFADLVLASDQDHLVKVFPTREQRERYIRYLMARYSPMHITWQGVQEFEEYTAGRELLKEIGAILNNFDPYQHPRSTHTTATSAPLLADGWMTHILYQTSSVPLGAVDRQIFTAPHINAEFAYEDSGAGKSHKHHVDSETFRKTLWNMTMNGQYPTFGNTGTYGGRKFEVDAKYLDSPGAKAMTAWNDFFARTRYWEIEPYFEVEGGRALALGGVEYIVYIEKPGPVEVVTEKKGYEVYWFRPATGEIIKEKKDYKGEKFTGQPPDNSSDWVLHLSRDGRKEGMLRSWKFESRRIVMQEIERDPKRTPFSIQSPGDEELPVGQPLAFAAKLDRETKASLKMKYLWTIEATAGGQGYRVLGDTQTGEFLIPPGLALSYPAVANLRLYGINGNGKLYSLDRVVKVRK